MNMNKSFIYGQVLAALLWIGPAFSLLNAAQTGQSGNAYQAYLKAMLLESQGNFMAAQEEIENALALAPESAYLHRTAAELSFRLGQATKARDQIERALELDSKDVRSLIISGQVHWTLGDSDKAIERLKKAVSLDPDEAEALISLAGALTPRDPQEAIKLYKSFLERHPNSTEIQERLAQIYQATNELDKAKNTWTEVLSHVPNSVRAHLALAQIAEINFDTATAISHYEGVLSQDPTNLPLLLRVGELRYRSDDMAKATEAFSKAQAIAPTSPGANFWLALLAENRGDWAEAIRHLNNVPESGQEPGVLLRLSYYYSQSGQKKEAVKTLKRLSAMDPSNTDFLNYLAAAYEQDNQTQQAEQTLRRVIELDPNDPDAHFRLGALYDRSGRFPKAVEEMRAAIRLKPDFDMALNYLGYSFADKNMNLDEAEQLVMDAMALEPDNPAYLDSMGWVYYRQGKYEKAKDFLTEAASRVRDATIFDHYGDVLFSLNQKAEAVQAWEQAIRINPKFPHLRSKIKKGLSQLSSSEKADLYMKRVFTYFEDMQSIKGLIRVSVCEKSPCVRSPAQFEYVKNDRLKVEIPGPLSGPVMQLIKKSGMPAQYGALHPQFQTVEFYVTSAFDRFESLISAEVFRVHKGSGSILSAVEKSKKLEVTASQAKFWFDLKTGRLLEFSWDNGETVEYIDLGKYDPFIPRHMIQSVEWRINEPSFKIKIEFLDPVVTLQDSELDP
ncbi:MAG: Lipopolysaccharide assembly protein B [Elusimicrobia bacterium]|nr:Lipopolysaccharide assembly protein B [Elusimicrobiota bacterium]